MDDRSRLRILVNLPAGFFTTRALQPIFRRLSRMGTVRERSHDALKDLVFDLAWPDVLLMWTWPVLTERALKRAEHLRFAGHINVCEPTARAELAAGVAVSEARHGWSPMVAEMALGLILSCRRRISDFHAAMRTGQEAWVRDFPLDIDPLERSLTGARVGIVGFGAIGQRLAGLLKPFRVDLRVFDPYVSEGVIRRHHACRCRMHELVRQSDVVVLCAANNEGTRAVMGRAEINAMRVGSLLVNVGRASLVDMTALEERLKQGDIMAALDVFDREPLARRSPLRRMDRAYLTPHRAGGIMESVQGVLTMLLDDLERFLAGKRRRYPVTTDMLHCLPDRPV